MPCNAPPANWLPTMDSAHRSIRAKLSTMSPRRAADYIHALGLPADEEACVIGVDVHGLSCVQVASSLHLSVDGFYKMRRRAYRKIVDAERGSTP